MSCVNREEHRDHTGVIMDYCIKVVSHAIYSHVLTGKTPCINQAINVLLMHSFCTLYLCILGRHKS